MSSEEQKVLCKEILSPEEMFGCISQRTLDIYAGSIRGEREDFIEHAHRVQDLVEEFAGEDLPPEAISLALVHDVVDRMINRESTKYNEDWAKEATKALLELFDDETISHEQLKYASCILADMIKVEQSAAYHRKQMADITQEDNESQGNTNFKEIYPLIAQRYMGSIPPEKWEIAQPLLDLNHMRREMEEVNIEAFIIKSAELLDNLRYPSSKRQSAILQDVLEAESFYAPILEAMGYEGFAAELRSAGKIRRLFGQGRKDLVEYAAEIQNTVLQIGIGKIADKVFGENDSTISYAVGKADSSDDYPIHMGEFAAETRHGNMVAGNWRVKSVGSLADKLKGGDGIMDIVGMMVISEDRKSVARDFANFIAYRLPEFKPVSSRNKTRPVYIQGTQKYVNYIEEQLHALGIDSGQYLVKIDTEETIEKRGYPSYEVSKVTFSVEVDGIETPIEVQFITKDERQRARTGKVSHVGYKYLQGNGYSDKKLGEEKPSERLKRLDIVASAEETLKALYKRRYDMKTSSKAGRLELNPASEDNQNTFLENLLTFLA